MMSYPSKTCQSDGLDPGEHGGTSYLTLGRREGPGPARVWGARWACPVRAACLWSDVCGVMWCLWRTAGKGPLNRGGRSSSHRFTGGTRRDSEGLGGVGHSGPGHWLPVTRTRSWLTRTRDSEWLGSSSSSRNLTSSVSFGIWSTVHAQAPCLKFHNHPTTQLGRLIVLLHF